MTPSNATPSSPGPAETRVVGRRTLLGWSGAAGAAGLALGGLGGALASERTPLEGSSDKPATQAEDVTARLAPSDAVSLQRTLPMGLADRVPAFGTLLAFDLDDAARASPATARTTAITFLRHLAQLADQASAGATFPGVGDPLVTTAAALDLRAANLQITPGFGASLLIACGLPHRRPDAFVDLPAFATDRLQSDLCGGDLMVQVGSEDPLKTSGATEDVMAFARSNGLKLRWARPGFRSTAATAENPSTTGRNVMGHRDGTDNPTLGSPLWQVVVTARSADWMAGGSYLVARQILLDLDTWFTHSEADRDRVIGRRTANGAALGEQSEAQLVDLSATTPSGALAIPPRAHIRLANAQNTAGARIYRRSWNFEDGYSNGARRAGLMFLAWQADPRLGFIPIQQELVDQQDALNQFSTHVGSAVFAAPARGEDDYVGQQLLEGS